MTINAISAQTLHQWMESGQAHVVDVREPAEYQAEHIASATLLPLSQVSAQALADAAAGKKLVVQCRKGGRGGSACQKVLAENPALEIYNLDGGLEAWVAAGYPVARGMRKVLPLDRQVQLTVGLMLILATLLAYAVSPAFLIVTGFMGCGLAFAGLTGFCGLARVLARMPWNQ